MSQSDLMTILHIKLYWCCHCLADVDYESGTFDVTFGVGDTSAEVSIDITDDSIDEESEVFGLVLKRADNTPDLVEVVEPTTAAGVIDDNDETGVCVCVFVCGIKCKRRLYNGSNSNVN